MFTVAGDQFLRRDLDAQVDDAVAVVGEDDFDQVLADVMHVALHRRQQDATPRRRIRALHVRFQVRHRELHGLGALQHLSNDQLVGVELPADLVHTRHQRAVDDRQRFPFLQRQVQVLGQTFLAALDDALRQPVVEGKSRSFLGRCPGGAVAEVRRKRRHGVLAPVPNQVLGQLTLFLGNAGVPLHHLGVHDGHVQAGLRAVIQEHRVKDLSAGSRQPEGDVGYPQDRLGRRQRLFDDSHALDGLRRRSHVVLVAGARREYQRVEDDVLFPHAILLGEQLVGTLGNFQLALPGDRLGLVGIVVDATDHERRAVASRQRHHALEPLLTILQVDGVDDGLALQSFQRLLYHRRVRRVDHDRRLDPPIKLIKELHDVGRLIPVRVLETHVQHMGAVPHLPSADLRRFLEPLTRYQPLEPATAQHVGAFADHRRPRVLVHHHGFDARHPRFHRRFGDPRTLAGHRVDQMTDVVRSSAATAAGDVEPSVGCEPFQGGRQHLRSFVVVAVFVRQPRVRHAGNAEPRQLVQRPDMVGHELRPGGAVEAHPQQISMRQ